MTYQDQVLSALRALVAAALPGVPLRGFTEDVSKPVRITSQGEVVGGPGELGEPEYELSPVAYTYTHHIPVEIWLAAAAGDAALRALAAPIGAAVRANRQLGGLVSWLEVSAPTITSENADNAVPARILSFDLIAEYTVTDPLA